MSTEEDYVEKIGEKRAKLIEEVTKDAWRGKTWHSSDQETEPHLYYQKLVSIYLGGLTQDEILYCQFVLKKIRQDLVHETFGFEEKFH